MNRDLTIAGGAGGAGIAGGLYMGHKMGSKRAGNTLRKTSEIVGKASAKHGRMAGRRMLAAKGSMGGAAALGGIAAFQHYGQGDTTGTVGFGALSGGAAALGVRSFMTSKRHSKASRLMQSEAQRFSGAAAMADTAISSGARPAADLSIEGAKRGARVSRAVSGAKSLSRVL